MFAALVSIAGAAEKLKVRRVARPTEDDRMDVIDLKVLSARADSASAVLLDVQSLDVGNREGSAGDLFTRAANVLVNLVQHANPLRIALLPSLDGLGDLLSVLCARFASRLLHLLGIVFLPCGAVLAVLLGILGAPFALSRAAFLRIASEPFARFLVSGTHEFRIGGVALGKVRGSERSAALDTSAYAGKALGYMAVLAGFPGKVSFQALLQGFLPRNDLHRSTFSMA